MGWVHMGNMLVECFACLWFMPTTISTMIAMGCNAIAKGQSGDDSAVGQLNMVFRLGIVNSFRICYVGLLLSAAQPGSLTL